MSFYALAYPVCGNTAMKLWRIVESLKRSSAMYKIYNFPYKLLFLLLAFLAMFRASSVGNDTPQFTNAFSLISNSTYFDVFSLRYEKGFIILCQKLGYLTTDSQILIAVVSLFITGVFAYTILNKSLSVFWGTLYFISFMFIPSMNLMRQFIAIGILLIAFPNLYSENKWRLLLYPFFVWCAAQFHSSAYLPGFLMLLFSFKRINDVKRGVLHYAIIIVSLFISNAIICSLLANKIAYFSYINNDKFGVSNYFGAVILTLFYIMIAVLYSISYFLYKRDCEHPNLLYNILFHCSWTCVLFYALSIKMQVWSRLSTYFSAVMVLAFPLIGIYYPKRLEQIWHWGLLIICLGNLIILTVIKPEWHGVIPYHFCF